MELEFPDKLFIKGFIATNRWNINKALGQNFLVSKEIAKKIVSFVPNGVKIIEIGPGFGAISFFLKDVASLYIGIEKDKGLFFFLKEVYEAYENVWIYHTSILDFPLEIYAYDKRVYVIGNIPYNITSLILHHIAKSKVKNAIIMVQEEVFERIVANPKSKNYSRLSVFVQTFFYVKRLLKVDKSYFYPKPKVNSVVFQLTLRDNQPIVDVEKYEKFLKSCFFAKRKKIYNNLTSSPFYRMDFSFIVKVFDEIGIFKDLRPEEIEVKKYIQLYNRVKEVL